MAIRSVAELTDVDVPAWSAVVEAIRTSSTHVEVLDVRSENAASTLHALQVTVGSVLGALAYNCGGLLVDHGWIRLLGGGTKELPSVAAANNVVAPSAAQEPPPSLTVGFDVIGGRFAIDGGGLGTTPGEVSYWAPDRLAWEGLGLGHGDFVHAFVSGAATRFYEPFRWDGWEKEVERISPDQGLSLMPPPFSTEGADPSKVSRRAVPFDELTSFYDEMAAKLNGVEDGERFRLAVED